MACLEELRRQQIIGKYVSDQKLMEDMMGKPAWEGIQKNIVMDGDTTINKRIREWLDPEADSTYWKDKFCNSLYRP